MHLADRQTCLQNNLYTYKEKKTRTGPEMSGSWFIYNSIINSQPKEKRIISRIGERKGESKHKTV